jgi:hypothetical protein
MGTDRYYAVTPEVAATLTHPPFWIWSDEQRAWNVPNRTFARGGPFVVVAVRNGTVPKGATELGTGNGIAEKDPSMPPLRNPDESEKAYKLRFKVQTPRSLADDDE